MEPKTMGFSGGAALLILLAWQPDIAGALGSNTSPELTAGTTGALWTAMTAVITPVATGPGKALLDRLTGLIQGAKK